MASVLQHLVLVMLFTSLLAWRLKSTHDNVIVNVTDDITLRCDNAREDNKEGESTIGKITRIRLVKLQGSSSNWKSVAEIIVPDVSRAHLLEEADFSRIVTSGHLGLPSQSFLSVTWPTESENTMGTYKCEVDGFVTEEVNDFHLNTMATNITNVVPSIRELVAIISQMKAKSEELSEKLETLTTKHDSDIVTLQREMVVMNEKQTLDIMNDTKRIVELNLVEAGIWPIGNYSLLATSDGCPSAVGVNQFRSGFIKVRGETSTVPKHNTSAMSHLSEPFFERCDSGNILNFKYCTHVTSIKQVIPTWPMGSYCISKHSGSLCPNNFQHGQIDFFLESSSTYVVTAENNPYYHQYRSKYQFEFGFCCRNDGSPNTAIILPTSEPFYLYRYKGVCQSVSNMDVTNEWIFVDTDDTKNDHYDRSVYPDSSLNDLRIELCYYTKKSL